MTSIIKFCFKQFFLFEWDGSKSEVKLILIRLEYLFYTIKRFTSAYDMLKHGSNIKTMLQMRIFKALKGDKSVGIIHSF